MQPSSSSHPAKPLAFRWHFLHLKCWLRHGNALEQSSQNFLTTSILDCEDWRICPQVPKIKSTRSRMSIYISVIYFAFLTSADIQSLIHHEIESWSIGHPKRHVYRGVDDWISEYKFFSRLSSTLINARRCSNTDVLNAKQRHAALSVQRHFQTYQLAMRPVHQETSSLDFSTSPV